MFLVARIDEADRGSLRKGQAAVIRADAVADREYHASVSDISLLARVDFTSGWPPTKQFDLKLEFKDPDERLRPGMSAAARVSVGTLEDVLLVPPAAVFRRAEGEVVYRLSGHAFVAVPVEVLRRGRDQAAIRGAINPGDRVALTDPTAAPEEGGS